MNKEEAMKQLETIADLKKGWDGYKAEPLEHDLLVKAREIFERVEGMHNWSIVPGAGQAVQIETHEGGFDIEIWISKA